MLINPGYMTRPLTAAARFAAPAGFAWTPDFTITRRGKAFFASYNPADDLPAGTALYIDAATGDDTTGDGTRGNPYKTPTKAKTEGATEIIFKDGIYNRDTLGGAGQFDFTTDTILRAENPGKVYMGRSNQFAAGSWIQQAAPNDSVYAVTRSNALRALDFTYRVAAPLANPVTYADGSSLFAPYAARASIAECQASPGSYYINGSTVYVHTWDSRAPDTDVQICLSENNITQTNEITLYAHGIVFYGEAPLRFTQTATNTARLVAVDCAFAFENDGDGLDVNDVADVRLIRCVAHHNDSDGFNYHIDSAHDTVTRVLEVDCAGIYNGASGGTNNNGSTGHDGVLLIRVNGRYEYNHGPQVADVSGARSLNYGCQGNHSQSAAGAGQSGFQCGTYSTDNFLSMMWLYDCAATGSTYDRYQATGGIIYTYGTFAGDGVNNGSIASTDSDAETYFAAVEGVDSIGAGEKDIITRLVLNLKAIGLWTSLNEVSLLWGPATTAGLIKKLKGSGDLTLHNFLPGDYSLESGLTGDGSTKYVSGAYQHGNGLTSFNALALFKSTGWQDGDGIMGDVAGADSFFMDLEFSSPNNLINVRALNDSAALTTVTSNTDLDPSASHVVLAAMSSLSLDVYVDGVDQATAAGIGGASLRNPTQGMDLFRYTSLPGAYLDGQVYAAAFQEASLSADERARLSNVFVDFRRDSGLL